MVHPLEKAATAFPSVPVLLFAPAHLPVRLPLQIPRNLSGIPGSPHPFRFRLQKVPGFGFRIEHLPAVISTEPDLSVHFQSSIYFYFAPRFPFLSDTPSDKIDPVPAQRFPHYADLSLIP